MIEKVFSPETYSLLGQWAFGFCKSLIVAAIVYFIGSKLIKLVSKLVVKALERSKVEPSLFSFLRHRDFVVYRPVCIGGHGHRHGHERHAAELCRRRDDSAVQAIPRRRLH